jgi:hypothetical protein
MIGENTLEQKTITEVQLLLESNNPGEVRSALQICTDNIIKINEQLKVYATDKSMKKRAYKMAFSKKYIFFRQEGNNDALAKAMTEVDKKIVALADEVEAAIMLWDCADRERSSWNAVFLAMRKSASILESEISNRISG